MPKTILITGSTDGIGLETAKMLALQNHHVLLHGRNPDKLDKAKQMLVQLSNTNEEQIESYVADLSSMADVEVLAQTIIAKHQKLDVLINNAGIYTATHSTNSDGLDVRFLVNTFAPYLLTQRLLPLLDSTGRVINLSSAAQSPVDPRALVGQRQLSDGAAYAQSKLAITMWSRHLALSLKENGPVVIAVNPGSMLASKMVKDAFGVIGNDIGIGADILCRAALDDEFAEVSGQYFDNDRRQFGSPHPDVLDPQKSQEIVEIIEKVLANLLD